MIILLPIATLRKHHACNLPLRLRDYRAHHGHTPGRAPTLRSWLACTPDVSDWLWATRCLGREGRILALEVATRAARRALAVVRWDHTADPRPERSVEAAEAVLNELWAGREPTGEMLAAAKAAAYAASSDAWAAADAAAAAAWAAEVAAAAAADAAAAAMSAAAYAATAADAAAAAAYADAATAADAAWAAADAAAAAAWAAEVARQRADYLAALDRLEAPDVR